MRISRPGTGLPSNGQPARAARRRTSTGLATCSRSSTRRSTASHTSPRIGGGNVPRDRDLGHAERAGTRRRAGSRAARPRRRTPRPRRGRRARRRSARCASGERSRPLIRLQRPGGEHPREVRTRGRRAAVGRRSTPSSARMGRGSPAARPSTRSAPVVIGDGQAADEAHVVVQRQPRDQRRRRRRRARRPAAIASRLAPSTRSREHHALGLGGRAARELQDRRADRGRAPAARAHRGWGRRAPGQHDRAAAPIGGSPGTGS